MTNQLRKRFGQHLLIDQSVIVQLVQAINVKPNQIVCEIGPGLGALTIPILNESQALHAVEIDQNLSAALIEKCKEVGELYLYQTDILKFDLKTISNKNQSIRLIGNLPYNISTPLLFHLLTFSSQIKDMHFMMQKEVIDRIVATTNSSSYGRLSIMVQSYFDVQKLFDINPECFNPPPKVMSSFLRLTPSTKFQATIKDRKTFGKVVQTAFQQRRKTIKNSLSTITTEEELHKADIEASLRAQEISIAQYITLSNIITQQVSHSK